MSSLAESSQVQGFTNTVLLYSFSWIPTLAHLPRQTSFQQQQGRGSVSYLTQIAAGQPRPCEGTVQVQRQGQKTVQPVTQVQTCNISCYRKLSFPRVLFSFVYYRKQSLALFTIENKAYALKVTIYAHLLSFKLTPTR